MTRSRSFLAIAATLLLLNALPAPAQTPSNEPSCESPLRLPQADLAGVYADYARTAELAGATRLRPRVIRRPSEERELTACERGGTIPWIDRLRPDSLPVTEELRITLLPARWLTRINTAYPTDRNDGALWAGRGVSTSLEAGVSAAWTRGPVRLSAGLAPRLLFHENRDFEIVETVRPATYSPYVYPWHPVRIDWPQRFGESAFWALDPGQSYVRVDAWGAALGFSTENLWWGPALRYPLLMSGAAPGFPHVFLGSSRPVGTAIGRFEGRLVWGWLSESDYFDARDWNDRHLFAGMVVDYEPRGLPGLFLGFTRAYLTRIPPEGLPLLDYVRRPYTNVRTNPLGAGNPLSDNQLFSFFARWAFPEVGFEAYAEWARDDHWEDLDDLLMEPDHAQAYMLGFQKVVPTGGRWLRIYGELAYLQSSTTYRSRRTVVTFYTHTPLIHGYTHRGQLLGAAIGPGSDAQVLGADLFADWGRLGLYVERIRHDNDAYYDTWARYYGYRGHDLELTTGVRHHFFDGDFHIGWGISYGTRKNRSFLGLDGANWDLRTETNWALDLEVTWAPSISREPRKPTISTRPLDR